MEEPFTIQNLRSFIRNFTSGHLHRMVSSTLKLTTYESPNLKLNATVPTLQKKIKELTTVTFLPTVLQQNKVVVIMYYSDKCSFCSGVSYVLLAVARMLESVTRLQFSRIDGDQHALPWEYTMHHYPTILFFPAQR